jgi:hypothetical protein
VDLSEADAFRLKTHDAYSDAGVIFSVIQSMLVEADGELESLQAPGGAACYRVRLPPASGLKVSEKGELPAELGPYIADWTALLGQPAQAQTALEAALSDYGVNLISAEDIVAVLARTEAAESLDAIILDKRLIMHEANGLLRALLKLRPSAGIVVLCESPGPDSAGLAGDIVFTAADTPPNEVILAIIEARSLALKRKEG